MLVIQERGYRPPQSRCEVILTIKTEVLAKSEQHMLQERLGSSSEKRKENIRTSLILILILRKNGLYQYSADKFIMIVYKTARFIGQVDV